MKHWKTPSSGKETDHAELNAAKHRENVYSIDTKTGAVYTYQVSVRKAVCKGISSDVQTVQIHVC